MPSSVMFWHSTCFREAISHICEAVFFAIFAMCAIFQLRTASHYAIILYLLPVFSSSFLSYIASSVLLSPNAASSLAES